MDDYGESMAFLAQANADAEAEAEAQAAQAEAEYEHEMFMQTQNDIINNSAGRGVFFDSKQLQFISDYVTAEIAKAFSAGYQNGVIKLADWISLNCKVSNVNNIHLDATKLAEATRLILAEGVKK